LRVIGQNLRTLRAEPRAVGASAERFARQVLMFGSEGQQILRQLTVVVVGAGGGGSLLVEMLAHLGVGRIIIVDYDVVDETNLSRIVGATAHDVGRLKVDIARDLVARIDPTIDVDAFYGDIAYVDDARLLRDANLAFLATDLMPVATRLDASAYYPKERELRARSASKRDGCRFCGDADRSALARGDLKALSLKPGSRPRTPIGSALTRRAPRRGRMLGT